MPPLLNPEGKIFDQMLNNTFSEDFFPLWQTELEEGGGPRLCWHLAVCFFSSVLDSGSHDARAWCAVSTVTQPSLPLSGEGDLFKILLQPSEPRRCHGMPKAERGTKGELRQNHWTHFREISQNLSVYMRLHKDDCFQWAMLTEPVK